MYKYCIYWSNIIEHWQKNRKNLGRLMLHKMNTLLSMLGFHLFLFYTHMKKCMADF